MQVETKLAVATVLSRFQIAVDPVRMPYKSAKHVADSLSINDTPFAEAGFWLHLTPRVSDPSVSCANCKE